jgi:hypothetical protein
VIAPQIRTHAQGATGRPCRVNTNHQAARSNYALLFGVAVIFTAWCDCGRFRFYGGDEDDRARAIGDHLAWARLARNDIAVRIAPESWWDGREFVVTAVSEDGVSVSVEDLTGDVLMEGVPAASFSPAGRQWVDTTCTHARRHRNWANGTCLVFRCGEPDDE